MGSAAPQDSNDSGDSGDSGDSATPTEGIWPPYAEEPSWTSSDEGYATGGVWADIDGDGLEDLVVAYGNDMAQGPLAVHLTQPDGSLAAAADWSSAELAYHGHIAAGDVDGDGWTDIAVALFLGDGDFDEPGGAALYLNQQGFLPDQPSWESEDRFFCFSVALGDIDNDGDLDLAAAAGEPYYHDPEPNRLFLNEGAAFQEPAAWISGEARHSMDVVFFDADANGALDLAFANGSSPHTIYLNQGAGLQAELPAASPEWEASEGPWEGNTADFGDIDGDGWQDLVISDNNQLGGSGTVSLYSGPDFLRSWESADAGTYQSAVALQDLDADGDLDLAAGSWWGPVRFYRNQGGLEGEPSAETGDSLVVEALLFHDLDGAATSEEIVQGDGPLLPLPRPCQVVETEPAGAVGDGYFSAASEDALQVRCLHSSAPDLLVTDWTNNHGNDLHLHLAGEL